jgi:hypothetical protein
MDAYKNFSVSAVATAPSPATSGTSLVVTAGHGTRFPATPFNATVWPAGTIPDPSNAEIVRVTTIATDTFTITRTQESSSARTIVVGDYIAATITKKFVDDVIAAAGAPGGSTTQVQFNDSSAFGGDAGLTYNKTTDELTMGLASVTGGQIKFPAAQSASTDANTLDDYEEGAWTPALTATGGASGQAYSAQVGRYIKIGKFVFCTFNLAVSTVGTLTGNVQFAGLPFTSRSTSGGTGGVAFGYHATMGTSLITLAGVVDPGATTATLWKKTSSTVSVSAVAQADFASGTDLFGTIAYEAST